MRALVTGADGFVGRWLVQHLRAEGDDVHEVLGPGSSANPGQRLDIRDAAHVQSVVRKARPECVYHLAAVSFGPDAANNLEHALDVTVLGTSILLRACESLEEPPVTLVVSSSEVYGSLPTRPITESDSILPATAYGATKLAEEAIGLAYDRSDRVPVVIARPFNHLGPGQRPQFVVPNFARQLAQIASGAMDSEVAVGNLGAVRDFTDVRDVVRAYRLAVTKAIRGRPLNIASGRGIAISDILNRMIAISGVEVSIEVEESRLRPIDVPSVVGDASLITELTGWRPEISLEDSLRAIWADSVERFGGPEERRLSPG